MKLITNKEVPEWYITYPNVQNGYRNIGNMKETFFSIFEWHNETLNIYTHLLPGLFYLWKFLNIIPNNLYSFELYFLINIAYFGAACMGIFSGMAHCLYIINNDWFKFSWKMDFIGIIAINFSHHLLDTVILTKGILNNRLLCLTGFLIETLFALFCIIRICFGDLDIGRFWAFFYPIITCIPLTSLVYLYSRIISVEPIIIELSQASMNCTLFICLAGSIFFKGGFPERYFNPKGIFNYFNSHTWHHILIIASIVAAFEGLPKLHYLEKI
jgi:adiponectin receptor